MSKSTEKRIAALEQEKQDEVLQNKPIQPVAKKKQIELNDDNLSYMSKHNWSEKAWIEVAKIHSFDPTTRERIYDDNDRAYLAVHKVWPKDPPKPAKPLSTIS